jgi:hypothetical protein
MKKIFAILKSMFIFVPRSFGTDILHTSTSNQYSIIPVPETEHKGVDVCGSKRKFSAPFYFIRFADRGVFLWSIKTAIKKAGHDKSIQCYVQNCLLCVYDFTTSELLIGNASYLSPYKDTVHIVRGETFGKFRGANKILSLSLRSLDILTTRLIHTNFIISRVKKSFYVLYQREYQLT